MILITGGTGTSGKPIVDALLARAGRVRVLARDPERAAGLLDADVEIARGDFEDPNSLEAAMDGVERALLLSAPTPRIVEMEKGFIDAAQRAGVPHVVKFSVYAADPGGHNRFARLHGRSEANLKSSGLAWTMLRPTFFMQNLLGLAPTVKSGGTIYMPAGDGKAPFVDTRDIAAVAAAALTEPGHAGETYEITGPRAIGMGDVARELSAVLGREVRYVDVAPEAAKQAMLQSGMSEWNADGVNELNAALKAGRMDRVTNTVGEVGKKEPVTLEHFIREHAGAFST